MPRLRHFAQERVIGMLQAGHQASAVSRIFNVHESTILRRRRRVQDTDSTDDRPRSGRPRATTVRQVRLILLIHLRDRFRPSTQTAAEIHGRDNHWISDQTVRNRLRCRTILQPASTQMVVTRVIDILPSRKVVWQ